MLKIPSLLVAMAAVPDHRRPNTVHPLPSILTMCVCAMLCGAKHPYAIFPWGRDHGARVAKLLGFRRRKTPSKWALNDALARLHIDDFETALAGVLAAVEGATDADVDLKGRQGAALDGKVLRGTFGHDDVPGLALVARFAHRTGWVLAQVPVEDTGELGAVRALVADTPLAGKVVTGDALQAQRDVSQTIVEKGAYFWTVKGNQAARRDAIEATLAAPRGAVRRATSHDVGHGRIETRTLTTTAATGIAWPGAKQVCRIERTVEARKDGACRVERVYAITSLARGEVGARGLLALARAHWSLENRLHYVRDVTLGEDASQSRQGNAPQAVAAVRNTVIGLLRLNQVPNIAAALRRFAAHVDEALALIGLQ